MGESYDGIHALANLICIVKIPNNMLTIFLQFLQLQVQVGRHALRDWPGVGVVVGPGEVRGLRRHPVTHRLQVGLREVGLHKSQGVLGRILGDTPDKDTKPPTRRL